MQPDSSEVADRYASLPGQPVTPSIHAACYFILGIELVERLCYFTIAGSQEFFLEVLGYGPAQSAGLNSAFSTLCYVWPLLGGYIADAFWGRYRTILIFAAVYLIGAFICSLSALPGELRSSTGYLLGCFGLIAMGTGGIKPNISNFGADQYDVSTEVGRRAQETFYAQFYVVVNIGSVVAYGWLTTLCSNGAEPWIPQKYGYAAAYFIGSGSMALALCIFLCFRSHYRRKPASGNALRGVVMHCMTAARRGSMRAFCICLGWPALLLGLGCSVAASFRPGSALLMTSTTLIFGGLACIGWGCSGDRKWVRRYARKNALVQRQDTADFLRIIPVLVTVSLSFNTIYNSMNFWFQQQACQMDLRIGNSSQLNGSFFTIADSLAIVILTPVILNCFNPLLARCSGSLTRNKKLLFGCALAAIAVLWAAQLEVQRRSAPLLAEMSKCAPEGIRMSALSGWWMVGPFAVMGVAEVYVNPTLYFLSYSQTPLRLRSTAQAVCLLTGAAASGLFTVLTNVLPAAEDLNEMHLEYGYVASIVSALPFLLCYLCVQGAFEEKNFDGRERTVSVSDLDEEDEVAKEAFKEVAYMRFGFFREFLSPRRGTFESPGSPGQSPLPSPRGSLFALFGARSYVEEDHEIFLFGESDRGRSLSGELGRGKRQELSQG